MYTTLDMNHAYKQVVLDEKSRALTTINTSKGAIPVRMSAFWCEFVSRYISEDQGAVTAEHTHDCRLPRRHPYCRKNTRRARSLSGYCANATTRRTVTSEEREMCVSSEIVHLPWPCD